MGKTTGIEWCDATWNPWYGCTKVSEGCRNCYAEREMRHYGKDFEVVRRAKGATFMAPYNWAEPKRIFVCSWGDFFHATADEWRDEAWEVMRKNPRHTYLILTKRPERLFLTRPHGRMPEDWGQGWPNVWIGTSLEDNSPLCINRLNALMKIPAAGRFVSCEPLLGPVNLAMMVEPSEEAWDWVNSDPDDHAPEELVEECEAEDDWINYGHDLVTNPEYVDWAYDRRLEAGRKTLEGNLGWVIGGGESGPGARQTRPEWAWRLRDTCDALEIPFFWKQWGEWLPSEAMEGARWKFERVGKAKAGRVLDGKEWTQTPWDKKEN